MDRYLRLEMAKRGWSQSDLAKAAGVSQGLISQWCRGRKPTARNILQISAALGESPEYIDEVVAHNAIPPRIVPHNWWRERDYTSTD